MAKSSIILNILSSIVNSTYGLRRKVNSEETYLLKVLKKWSSNGDKLLDVGCGFGRFYEIIRSEGVEYIGVDVNKTIVKNNLDLGRTVYHETEFRSIDEQYEILLFSHIIEHFDCISLVTFLNKYLYRVKKSGIIIIFSPLLHRGFYDDFDHVKPYNPAAIRQLFCKSSNQTQSFGLHGKYEEVDLWFKHDPLWHSHRTGVWTHLFSVPLTLACVLSYGIIGRLNGYGMVLKKTE